MKRFLKDPAACQQPGNPVLEDLIYGWGNEVWSALDEYLSGCIRHALTRRGPILECGSGLSTILVGAVAKRTGQTLWTLEHTPEWARRVRRYLKVFGIDSVKLFSAPLKDYGEFSWYQVPPGPMPDNWSLVVCDGPPGQTAGGRYGLVPIMKDRLGPGSVILLDDADRKQERSIAKRWETELNATAQTCGSKKRYIEMVVG